MRPEWIEAKKTVEPFDFNQKPCPVSWLVDSLIPLNHVCGLQGMSTAGKSWVLAHLAICLTHKAKLFDQFNVEDCDVLYIDQDTATDDLKRRLLKLSQGSRKSQNHNLYVLSQQGLSMSSGTLQHAIREHGHIPVVILDSLISTVGSLNTNSSKDMQHYITLGQECRSRGQTLVISEHISEKRLLSVFELMTSMPNNLGMGSSVINQHADTYFIVAGKASNGKLTRQYIRPVSKRAAIPTGPFQVKFDSPKEDKTEWIYYDGPYDSSNEVQADIMALFNELQKPMTVTEVYNELGGLHGICTVRQELANLNHLGKLHLVREKHNLFRYVPISKEEEKQRADEINRA